MYTGMTATLCSIRKSKLCLSGQKQSLCSENKKILQWELFFTATGKPSASHLTLKLLSGHTELITAFRYI
jgi:hypothetical protein